ncbi:MAG TPA: rRNA maturation RNase YbeY [Candidatus Gracilibacteria bacterium]|nr:rRNA maturation RNase YbeY [Candidatus Gracilibacteria bacterium]
MAKNNPEPRTNEDFVYIDGPDLGRLKKPRSRKIAGYVLEIEQRIDGYKMRKSHFEPVFAKAIGVLKKQKYLAPGMKGGLIELVLISDEEIRIINRSYRQKDTPTDVISLSYFGKELVFPRASLVGEIFISLDTARRQAAEHKKTLVQELQFLFVHGVLHIFGYDHEKTAERKIMFDLQDKILGTKMWRKIID